VTERLVLGQAKGTFADSAQPVYASPPARITAHTRSTRSARLDDVARFAAMLPTERHGSQPPVTLILGRALTLG
jgi:hypothetical protein